MATLIVGCEIAFWLVLVAGLAIRYLLRRTRLATIVLACVPVVDLVLIVAVALDLASGAAITSIHGLAAYYLGFSVAFGPVMVRAADVRFAHRFAGGPAPVKPARGSAAKLRAVWHEWLRVVLGAGIGAAIVLLLIWVVADEGQAEALWPWTYRLAPVVGIWFAAGPGWELCERGTHQPAQ